MIKLTKIQPATWLGNGMGTLSAVYVVTDAPHITVSTRGPSDWSAFDTQKNEYIIRPFGYKLAEIKHHLSVILHNDDGFNKSA